MLAFTVFERMRADHACVLGELATLAVERERGDPVRYEEAVLHLVRVLERQFDTHMRAEEEMLFPALVEALPAVHGILVPLRSEHSELRTRLAALVRLLAQPRSPAREQQVAAQAGDLVDLLRIHVHNEEALVYSVVERVLPEPTLHRIAGRLAYGLSHARGRPDRPPAPPDAAGRATGSRSGPRR